MGLLDLRKFGAHLVDRAYMEASKPYKIVSAITGTDMRQKLPNVSLQSMSLLEPRWGSLGGAGPWPGCSPHHTRASAHGVLCRTPADFSKGLPSENINAFASLQQALHSHRAGLLFPTQWYDVRKDDCPQLLLASFIFSFPLLFSLLHHRGGCWLAPLHFGKVRTQHPPARRGARARPALAAAAETTAGGWSLLYGPTHPLSAKHGEDHADADHRSCICQQRRWGNKTTWVWGHFVVSLKIVLKGVTP